MSDREHARNLLTICRTELRALRAMLDPAVFGCELFGFHCQQVVEKALKACLAAHGLVYPRTHDLTLLFDLAADSGTDLSEFADLDWLTPFAVRWRYDVEPVGELSLDRAELVSRVEGLVSCVASLVDQADGS